MFLLKLVFQSIFLSFLRHPVMFSKNNVFFIFYDHSIRVAYFGFHTLLYFAHRVFLALDNMFSYYNNDIQRNQNKVINGRSIVFCFSRFSVL